MTWKCVCQSIYVGYQLYRFQPNIELSEIMHCLCSLLLALCSLLLALCSLLFALCSYYLLQQSLIEHSKRLQNITANMDEMLNSLRFQIVHASGSAGNDEKFFSVF